MKIGWKKKKTDEKIRKIFQWNTDSNEPSILLRAADMDDVSVIKELYLGSDDIRVAGNDVSEGSKHFILEENRRPIAAILYTDENRRLRIKAIKVHPMYPENAIKQAIFLLLTGENS